MGQPLHKGRVGGMRFSRTETSLKALSGRKQLTLNDVLDLFYDLGADIRGRSEDDCGQAPGGAGGKRL